MNDADADNDGVPDVADICPFDRKVTKAGFSFSEIIHLGVAK